MIYKPSHCSPSLSSISLEGPEDIYFECVVDSSNVDVSGYSLTLWNSANKKLFPTSDGVPAISLISQLSAAVEDERGLINSGVNGTLLRFPFIVSQDKWNSFPPRVQNNCFYRGATPNTYYGTNVSFTLNPGETYKWSITLYHLNNGSFPTGLTFFDTPVASGVVSGSSNSRIQALYSDNIYSGYYLQPIRIANLSIADGYTNWTSSPPPTSTRFSPTYVGERVKIEEYDYTYGFIYPEQDQFQLLSGVISPDSKANAFLIYKYPSSYAQTESSKRVEWAPPYNAPLTWLDRGEDSYGQFSYIISSTQGEAGTVWAGGVTEARRWLEAANNGLYYPFVCAQQTTQGALISLDAEMALDLTARHFVPLHNNDLVLLNFQLPSSTTYATTDTRAYTPASDRTTSVENGIFAFSGDVKDISEAGSSTVHIQCSFTFKRANSASSINDMVNNAYCVADSQLSASYAKYAGQVVTLVDGLTPSALPILNQIAIKLGQVGPEQIYNFGDNEYWRNHIGIINYNSNKRLFVRPSRGVEPGMRLILKDGTNYRIDKIGILNDIDAVSYVETSSNVPAYVKNGADFVAYDIKSCFLKSDENYFTVETAPTIQFSIGSHTYSSGDLARVGRSCVIGVNYSQPESVSWSNFQFSLLASDEDGNAGKILKTFPRKYNGKMEVSVEGLCGSENGTDKYYLLILQGQSVSGLPFEARLRLHPNFSESNAMVNSSVFSTQMSKKNGCISCRWTAANGVKVYRREIWVDELSGQADSQSLFVPVYVSPSGVTSGEFNDYNLSNGSTYDYVAVMQGDREYRSIAEAQWRGWYLSELLPQGKDDQGIAKYLVDENNVWRFKYNVSPGEFSQEMQRTPQDTMGPFAQVFTGPKKAIAGSVQCLLGDIAQTALGQTIYSNYTNQKFVPAVLNGEIVWQESIVPLHDVGGYQEKPKTQQRTNAPADLLDQWKSFCFSPNPKLLQDEKGQSFIVEILSASFSVDSQVTGLPTSVQFQWEQIDAPQEAILIAEL